MTRRLELGGAELFRQAASTTDEGDQKKLRTKAAALAAWARKAQSAGGIRRALEVAQTLAPVTSGAGEWDRAPWLTACSAGTLDLRTGELNAHRREDMITLLAGGTHQPDAKAPTWESFLERILPDADLRAFAQRALGYSMTGDTSEQVMFVCYGSGANGKSTMLETVRHVLSDYAVHVQTDTLMAIGRGRGADNDLMRLRGARFVTAIETGEGRKLDEPRIKALTGGDTVTARLLYHEPVEFVPQCKIWLATNHRPEVTGNDHAIWRRLRLIPFEVQIPSAERDKSLLDKLRAEASGILSWLLRGCLEWQRTGLQPPDAVMAATDQWRTDSDELARFIGDRCTVLSGVRARSGELYSSFVEWARSEGNREPLSSTAFGRRLTDAGYAELKSNGQRYRRGLGLQANEPEGLR